MKDTRRIKGIIGLSLMAMVFTGLLILAILSAPTNWVWIGIGIGVTIGGLGCIILQRTYDFAHMRPRSTEPVWLKQWAPFIAIAIFASGSAMRLFLDDAQLIGLGSGLLTILILPTVYLGIQTWRYRPMPEKEK
jgi:Na+-driven multidrug efflux pump